MKRGTALTCALMIVMMNTPAASAERNIVSTIRGADYAISVDADVYGEGTSGLQAYRVQTLEWGRNPETHFDLSLWFDADVPTEKADFDCTVFIRRATKRGSENATKRGSAHTAYPLCARRMRG